MRLLLIPAVVCLLATPAWARQPLPAPRQWALLIGVNQYVDGTLRSLDYAGNDARLMYRVLTTRCHVPPEQIILMTDDQADPRLLPFQRPVQAEIERLTQLAGPGDSVLIFFSGHGIADSEGRVALAPRDCQRSQANETGIPAAWLKKSLESCPAARKLLILDCCHAGAAKSAGLTSELRLAPCFEQAHGLVTLASCGPDELSQEWPTVHQGLFTFFLARGLEGTADLDGDGVVDVEELYKFLYNEVSTTALKERRVQQHPQLYRAADTTGVFAVATLAGAEVPYPLRCRPGQPWVRQVSYNEKYTLKEDGKAWLVEYQETQRQRIEVRQSDPSGRPTHLAVHFDEHQQRTQGRLPNGSRNRQIDGPLRGKTVLQEWHPGSPLSLVLQAGADHQPARHLPHPLAVDEALLPDVRLKVGDTAPDSGRIVQLLQQLAPEANIELTAAPAVTLARVEEGGRVLVFEGRLEGLGCLGTPSRTHFDATWKAEYVPEEARLRAVHLIAESRRVVQRGQEFYLVITCDIRNGRE